MSVGITAAQRLARSSHRWEHVWEAQVQRQRQRHIPPSLLVPLAPSCHPAPPPPLSPILLNPDPLTPNAPLLPFAAAHSPIRERGQRGRDGGERDGEREVERRGAFFRARLEREGLPPATGGSYPQALKAAKQWFGSGRASGSNTRLCGGGSSRRFRARLEREGLPPATQSSSTTHILGLTSPSFHTQ